MISEIDINDWGDYPTGPITSKEQYEHYLSRFDWTFEYSDDHAVWKRAVRTLQALSGVAEEFDPHSLLWSKYAPDR